MIITCCCQQLNYKKFPFLFIYLHLNNKSFIPHSSIFTERLNLEKRAINKNSKRLGNAVWNWSLSVLLSDFSFVTTQNDHHGRLVQHSLHVNQLKTSYWECWKQLCVFTSYGQKNKGHTRFYRSCTDLATSLSALALTPRSWRTQKHQRKKEFGRKYCGLKWKWISAPCRPEFQGLYRSSRWQTDAQRTENNCAHACGSSANVQQRSPFSSFWLLLLLPKQKDKRKKKEKSESSFRFQLAVCVHY